MDEHLENIRRFSPKNSSSQIRPRDVLDTDKSTNALRTTEGNSVNIPEVRKIHDSTADAADNGGRGKETGLLCFGIDDNYNDIRSESDEESNGLSQGALHASHSEHWQQKVVQNKKSVCNEGLHNDADSTNMDERKYTEEELDCILGPKQDENSTELGVPNFSFDCNAEWEFAMAEDDSLDSVEDCPGVRENSTQITKDTNRHSAVRLGNTPPTLSEIVEAQNLCLERHGLMKCASQVRGSLPSSSREPKRRKLSNNHKQQLTLADRWGEDVRHRLTQEADFFSSDEACFRLESKVSRGRSAYCGIPLNQFNNEDMRYLYHMEYEGRTLSVKGTGTFDLICSTAGQIMRFAVTVQLVHHYRQVADAGALFCTVCDREVLKVFLNYFRLRCSITTVCAKANQVLKILEVGCVYFEEKGMEMMKGKVHAAQRYVRTIRNEAKQEGRRRTAVLRMKDDRELSGTILHPEDFEKFTKICSRRLNAIMKSFEMCLQRQESQKARLSVAQHFFGGNDRLLNKWCLNFTAIVILGSAGQRPETFWQMQVPSKAQLQRIEEDVAENDYFGIPIQQEKTPRAIVMPHPIMPSAVFKFFKFHISYVRPVVLWKSKQKETSSNNRPLLLHSKKGCALHTSQITRAIRSVIKHIDPEFGNVSVMMLRSSFATMMFERFHRKEFMKNKSEEEFLQNIAIYMNTSIEQLKATYVCVGERSFSELACDIARALPAATCNESESEDSGGDLDQI